MLKLITLTARATTILALLPMAAFADDVPVEDLSDTHEPPALADAAPVDSLSGTPAPPATADAAPDDAPDPATVDEPLQLPDEIARELCLNRAELGEKIMRMRQIGVPVQDAHGWIDRAEDAYSDRTPEGPVYMAMDMFAKARIMIDYAYSETRWNSDSAQARAISDFGSEIYTLCRQSG